MSKELVFEDALKQLQGIVETMQRGSLSLEESMKLFEQGTALVRACTKQLDDAELRVAMLLQKNDGSVEEVPFDEVSYGSM